MRTRVTLCLIALLVLAGCNAEPPATAPGGDLAKDLPAVAAMTAAGQTDPLPGGYYSFRWWDSPGYYGGFERIDTRTGLGSLVWNLQDPGDWSTPLGLAFDLDGTMYTTLNYMDFTPENCWSQFARIDAQTGAITRIGPTFPMNTCGGDIDSHGDYFVTGMDVPHLGYIHGDGYLYRFDKRTGVATQIGYTGMTDWMDMAFDSRDRLYATTQNKLFILDTTTGAGTFVADIAPVPDSAAPRFQEVMSIAFDAKDNLYGTAMTVFWDDPHGSPVFRIDPRTGAATLLGHTEQYYNHGGDIFPATVKICHLTGNGRYVPLTVSMNALAAHRAHGDIVPGVDTVDCGCPATSARAQD